MSASVVIDRSTIQGACELLLLLIQLPAIALLLSRLLKGPTRYPPIQPRPSQPQDIGTVSAVVPTLNEAQRISPLLVGLSRQSYELREAIVVDSHSQDGTPELVKAAGEQDPRFRLIQDDPLPPGWVGRPWALHTGYLASNPKSEWILGLDADTQPHPGLVAGLLEVAQAQGYDLVSLSPRFILKYPGELLLQPALLMTLVYRFGPTGTPETPERVMANGQCFLCRRSVLEALGGYAIARSSFCDDVTLARYAAQQGYKVGFLDGSEVLKVRMYDGAWDTWQGWGRSLDLKDASSRPQLWQDLAFLFAVQALPLPMMALLLFWQLGGSASPILGYALGLNGFLVFIRFALGGAIASAYDRRDAQYPWLFWFSPLADPLAFLRIWLSSTQSSIQWRGREYQAQ